MVDKFASNGGLTLEEVRKILSSLPPGERMYWDPLIAAVEALDDDRLSTFQPLLYKLAQSCSSVRTRLAAETQLADRSLQEVLRTEHDLAQARTRAHQLLAELSEAEIGLLSKDFDRSVLREEVQQADKRIEALKAELHKAEEMIKNLRQRLDEDESSRG